MLDGLVPSPVLVVTQAQLHVHVLFDTAEKFKIKPTGTCTSIFLHACVKHGLRLEALESRRTHSMQHSVFEGLQIVHVPASSLSSSGHDNGLCNRQPQLSFQGSRVCVATL